MRTTKATVRLLDHLMDRMSARIDALLAGLVLLGLALGLMV
jgi:hypothetical protein